MKLIPRYMVRKAIGFGDLLHTINGGVAETSVRIQEHGQGQLYRVSAPSVQPEAFKVMIHGSRLTVFSELANVLDAGIRVPLFHRVFELPPQADASRIDALYQDGELLIKVPLASQPQQPRLIQIRKV